jgi:hypothetical protein
VKGESKKRKLRANTNLFINIVNEKTRVSNGRMCRMLDAAHRLIQDQGLEDRRVRCMCPPCYYSERGGVVCHAFTRWECAICAAIGEHPNTRVPLLCLTCASRYGLCVVCMADMGLETRTKEHKRRTK